MQSFRSCHCERSEAIPRAGDCFATLAMTARAKRKRSPGPVPKNSNIIAIRRLGTTTLLILRLDGCRPG